MKKIALIYTQFPKKFGVPRQSGLVEGTVGKIVFEPEFRSKEAVRGLEEFSHLWLIWGFSENKYGEFAPTVRPPRLGGNERKGVFATRSPFRPNGLGLSSLKIERIELECENAPVIYVKGVDMLDGTPVYDIKPYVSADCHTDAVCGFESAVKFKKLKVEIKEELTKKLSDEELGTLKGILENDPRPAYQNDSERIYGMRFDKYEIKFKVDGDTLTIKSIDIK